MSRLKSIVHWFQQSLINGVRNLLVWFKGLLIALWKLWCALGPKWFRVSVIVLVLLIWGGVELKQALTPNLTRESIASVTYLNHGWEDKDRQRFYYTPQGTELLGLQYDWFINLELPLSHERLANEHNLRGWGFILDPLQQASEINPGNLPVGMTQHADPVTGKPKLDLSCAMCHTGELHYNGHALRVDGGQAMQSVATAKLGEFITTLGASVVETLVNPAKWQRFARRVVGEDKQARDALYDALWQYAGHLKTFMQGAGNPKWYPVTEGRGRTDAVGRIANVVFGYDLGVEKNYHEADAPASYPFIWDIWRFDWVQYTGFTNQAMARNVGEALGVLAPISLVDEAGKLLEGEAFGQTTINIHGMQCIESTLRKLEPPRWPEHILGEIDIAKARQGKTLFLDKCQFCHGPHPAERYNWPLANAQGQLPGQIGVNEKWDNAGQVESVATGAVRPDWREILWAVPWISTDVIGTDSRLADNYMDNRYDGSKLVPGSEPVNAGDGLQLLLNRLVPALYRRNGIMTDTDSASKPESVAQYDGLNVPFRIENQRAYKARPLHGVWATPPFLHNGSVPSLYDLLSPQDARPVTFYVGNREYDPDKLGYVTDKRAGSFHHDTRIGGNHNTGHLFTDEEVPGRIGNLLSESERMALLEYIKVMGNPDFNDRLQGDPLNWSTYPRAPQDTLAEQACRAVGSSTTNEGVAP